MHKTWISSSAAALLSRLSPLFQLLGNVLQHLSDTHCSLIVLQCQAYLAKVASTADRIRQTLTQTYNLQHLQALMFVRSLHRAYSRQHQAGQICPGVEPMLKSQLCRQDCVIIPTCLPNFLGLSRLYHLAGMLLHFYLVHSVRLQASVQVPGTSRNIQPKLCVHCVCVHARLRRRVSNLPYHLQLLMCLRDSSCVPGIKGSPACPLP